MEEKLIKHIDTLINRYPNLIVCKDSVIKAYENYWFVVMEVVHLTLSISWVSL